MFYGPEQAGIHDRAFGRLAVFAGDDLIGLLRQAGLRSGKVVDLGSGSGILARRLTEAGYEVVGVDISAAMVELAQRNTPSARFVVGSLYDAPLPDGCVGVAATGEAVNYATDERAGIGAFSRLAAQVHEALAPGGWWIMDISGPGRGGADRTSKQFHRHDDWCLGMTAIESEDGVRLDREITIFAADAPGDRHYRRIEEHHTLRLFRREEIKEVLSGIGFEVDLLTDYRSPPVQLDLPGWYIVQAQKPVR